MDIIFARHGQKEHDDRNGFDLKLSEQGFREAEALGIRLKDFSISRIYSSDMIRARQTADTANRQLGLPIEYCAELREIDMGIFQDGISGLEQQYGAFAAEFDRHESDLAYPDGESGAQAWARMKPIVPRLIERTENCLVIAHGGTIRVMLCGMLGIGFEKRFMFGNPVHTCGLTVIRYDEIKKSYSLQLFNDGEHVRDINSKE